MRDDEGAATAHSVSFVHTSGAGMKYNAEMLKSASYVKLRTRGHLLFRLIFNKVC